MVVLPSPILIFIWYLFVNFWAGTFLTGVHPPKNSRQSPFIEKTLYLVLIIEI